VKKVISFSLWGSDPKYTVGALKNAQLALEIYPDWICRYYISKCVPMGIIQNLIMMPNTEVVVMNEQGDWNGSLWRFAAASDPTVDIVISRDTDSRLNLREKAAVEEWLSGDKNFHIMRDHPAHDAAIMAGMWGVRDRLLFNMTDLIRQYPTGDFWQIDQNFLRDRIYPAVRAHTCVHDEFFEKKPFPLSREGGNDKEGNPMNFVGQVFNEHDVDSREWWEGR